MLFVWVLTLNTYCGTMRTLDLGKLEVPIDNEILGIYEWMLRGHFSRITIESEKRFRYDYGNSGSRGYYTGSYALNDNLLTLVSDSVISEELIHIIEGQDTVRRDLDKTEFMFIVTKKGLHQKNIAGDFWKKPSLIKK